MPTALPAWNPNDFERVYAPPPNPLQTCLTCSEATKDKCLGCKIDLLERQVRLENILDSIALHSQYLEDNPEAAEEVVMLVCERLVRLKGRLELVEEMMAEFVAGEMRG